MEHILRKLKTTIDVVGDKVKVGEDSYGDPIYKPSMKTVEVHSVQPKSVDEADGGMRWSTTELDVFSYTPLHLDPADTVVYRGERYQVDGPPAHFRNPYTLRELTRQTIKLVGDAT